MNGFHGVNGTAAVTLTGELHAGHRSFHIFRGLTIEPEGTDNGGSGAVILSEVFYVGILFLISIRCSWILERYIPATSREI